MTTNWALPEQIRRGRTSLWLSVPAAAEMVGASLGDLTAWEAGTAEPDDEDLWQLAEAYGRPVAYFFVPTSDPPSHQDFRTEKPLDPHEEFNARRAAVARFEELCRFQRDLEALMGEPQGDPIVTNLRGRAPAAMDGEDLAAWLRHQLGLGHDPIRDARQFLEALGIRVFVVDVPTAGFSGTCWHHPDFGPAVLMNRKDPEPRRAFTAAHELAHLLRKGDQYLCGFLGDGRSEEAFANRFAAALLMPLAGIQAIADELRSSEALVEWDTKDSALDKVARRFGVSREAASWRLEQLGFLPSGFTAVKRSLWASRQFYRGKPGSRWRHRLQDLSPRHLRLARRAYQEGRLSVAAFASALQIDIEDAYALADLPLS